MNDLMFVFKVHIPSFTNNLSCYTVSLALSQTRPIRKKDFTILLDLLNEVTGCSFTDIVSTHFSLQCCHNNLNSTVSFESFC